MIVNYIKRPINGPLLFHFLIVPTLLHSEFLVLISKVYEDRNTNNDMNQDQNDNEPAESIGNS